MILITGAGRSGTKYMAKALQKCGLDIRHERIGTDGIMSGLYCFESDWYPGDNHPVPRPQFDLILHQVRHPLRTIASLQTTDSWDWSCQFFPVDEDAPLLKRCCYNWYIANKAAAEQAIFTYRIENLENMWSELQRLIGFDVPYETIADMPYDINSRPHDDITWVDVWKAAPEIYADIIDIAQRYGYNL